MKLEIYVHTEHSLNPVVVNVLIMSEIFLFVISNVNIKCQMSNLSNTETKLHLTPKF